jgi:hypothetical protein
MINASNPNDQIRGEILQYLYDIHSKSRSPKTASAKISEINQGMKTTYGYKQNQVSCNLDYLVQEKYVVENREPRSFRTRAGTVQNSEQITYKISSVGINRLEKASLYKAPALGGLVNISNVNGVVVVGDGNVVNSTYTEAANLLGDLRRFVAENDQMEEEHKISMLSDLDAMTMQMQKPKPDPKILNMLWTSAKTLATMNGAITLVQHLDHVFKGLGW